MSTATTPATRRLRVVIASAGGQAPAIPGLRADVLGAGLACGAEDCVGLGDLAVRLARSGADVVLIAVDPGRDDACDSIRAAARPGVPVLAVGPEPGPRRVLELIRSGAREFLPEGNLRGGLASALEGLDGVGALMYRRGRAVAVAAAAGGSGVTTIASGLAFALGARRRERPGVALAELGNGTPELALALDLDPPHSLEDLARQRDRADVTLLRRAMVDHPAGVSILAHGPGELLPSRPDLADMRQILVLLKAGFDHAVLDLGHGPAPASLEAMPLAEVVLVATRLDVPSLRRTRAFIAAIEGRGIPSARIVPVANAAGRRGEVAEALANEALGRRILARLPDDPAAVNRALSRGEPLAVASGRSALARAISSLAGRIASAVDAGIAQRGVR